MELGVCTWGAKALQIFQEIDKILEFITPNISRLKEGATPKNIISTPNILHLPAPLKITGYHHGI